MNNRLSEAKEQDSICKTDLAQHLLWQHATMDGKLFEAFSKPMSNSFTIKDVIDFILICSDSDHDVETLENMIPLVKKSERSGVSLSSEGVGVVYDPEYKNAPFTLGQGANAYPATILQFGILKVTENFNYIVCLSNRRELLKICLRHEFDQSVKLETRNSSFTAKQIAIMNHHTRCEYLINNQRGSFPCSIL